MEMKYGPATFLSEASRRVRRALLCILQVFIWPAKGSMPGQSCKGSAVFVTNYDFDGAKQWIRQFGDNALAYPDGLAVEPQTGQVYVAGQIIDSAVFVTKMAQLPAFPEVNECGVLSAGALANWVRGFPPSPNTPGSIASAFGINLAPQESADVLLKIAKYSDVSTGPVGPIEGRPARQLCNYNM
jgi:hypothetical protein